ncbi:MAP kinase kinase (MEK) [Entomophthora muscae]|uniref:MAP kinase kinase (MEK) n=2 Tax=Entomophthora muscae TaxID=34485 RepID=A0ACC2TM05_9FUNG|nr:MAP kinase kinase (MEK) [Entomophthora muscae]KAJ9075637.1 MAP kinase kinase (MEK) [Entomophthora muscae]
MSGIKKKRNFKGLALPETNKVELRQEPKLPDLEIGTEFKLDLREEDLQNLEELGAGNGGTVSRALHIPTKKIMAKKLIRVETSPEVRKQILRELQILHDCNHINIISFYGAFNQKGNIAVCMEFMDVGSFDCFYKKFGAIPIDVVGKVAVSVLDGLIYLYDNHKIIHRDVKPSNILLNSQGKIKLCDFGVSGVLINSVANTFVGTSAYMSPERIQGSSYTVKSDVWSLGITLLELAQGRFPFPPDGTPLAVFELLEYIVNEPAPVPPANQFPKDFVAFIQKTLIKEHDSRPPPKALMLDLFIIAAQETDVDMEKWIQSFSH